MPSVWLTTSLMCVSAISSGGAGQGEIDLLHGAVQQWLHDAFEFRHRQRTGEFVDSRRRVVEKEILRLILVAQVDFHLLRLEAQSADEAVVALEVRPQLALE